MEKKRDRNTFKTNMRNRRKYLAEIDEKRLQVAALKLEQMDLMELIEDVDRYSRSWIKINKRLKEIEYEKSILREEIQHLSNKIYFMYYSDEENEIDPDLDYSF